MSEDLISVYTTLPDRESADRLARALVEGRLAACANAFPVESVFRWQGQLEQASEWALILKTRWGLYAEVERRIRESHPYEVPAVVAYDITAGLPDYLAWIRASTREPS
jgi:periplasmic divalent cation tolerance protein